MLPVQQQQQGRERARTRVTGQHNERDMGCQLRQLLLQWYWMLQVCVSGCECVHKFVSAHFLFFLWFLYIYITLNSSRQKYSRSRQKTLGTLTASHAHVHTEATSSGLPWECLWHYVSYWGDAFNPETNLDFVLCVSSCVWASMPVYKAPSRSH